MKHILLTISLIVFANSVSATSLSIKHNKKLPTPYELIKKGKILDKQSIKGAVIYFIDWEKTDDIYRCHLTSTVTNGNNMALARCYLAIQETITDRP